jgi:putative membrane protein
VGYADIRATLCFFSKAVAKKCIAFSKNCPSQTNKTIQNANAGGQSTVQHRRLNRRFVAMQHPPAEKSFKSRFRQVFALADGCEPDPRFTLANERTFLAWIRTALALLASGIALDALPLELLAGRPQTLLSHALTGMALLVSVNATLRWLNVERALRHRQALPYPILAPLLGLFGLIVSTLLLLP